MNPSSLTDGGFFGLLIYHHPIIGGQMRSLEKLFVGLRAVLDLDRVLTAQFDQIEQAFLLPETLEAIGICSEMREADQSGGGVYPTREIVGASVEAVRLMRYFSKCVRVIDKNQLSLMTLAVDLWHGSIERKIEVWEPWEKAIQQQGWYLELVEVERKNSIASMSNDQSSIANAVFWFIRDNT